MQETQFLSVPGLGSSPGEGNGNPIQYPYLEDSMDRGYNPWYCRVGHDWATSTAQQGEQADRWRAASRGLFGKPVIKVIQMKGRIFTRERGVCGTSSLIFISAPFCQVEEVSLFPFSWGQKYHGVGTWWLLFIYKGTYRHPVYLAYMQSCSVA